MENNLINMSKYVDFDKSMGRFCLTNEASQIIYREKSIICSYSGADEWCNHFVCELIDLYCGCSKYNYALGTTVHETRIPEAIKEGYKEEVMNFINRMKKEEWGIKVFKMFDSIIDDLPIND